MADGALLLVDAAEGPLPQTRFVLRKCLELGFPVIVVINKIDRSDARPERGPERGLRPLLRSRGHRRADRLSRRLRHRQAGHREDDARRPVDRPRAAVRLDPRARCRPRPGDASAPLQILVSNLDHDDYVGRLAIGRIVARHGAAPTSPSASSRTGDASRAPSRCSSTFEGLKRAPTPEAAAGEIVAIAGIDDVYVGDTIVDLDPGLGDARAAAHPRRAADASRCKIGVNTSPFAGKMQGVEVPDEPPAPRAPHARDAEEPRDPARGDRVAGHVRRSSGAASSSSPSSSRRCGARATRCSSATPRSSRRRSTARSASRWSSSSSTFPSSSSASSPSASASGAAG